MYKRKKPPSYMKIPMYIAHDDTINPAARLMYGDIYLLTHKEGFCWANNRYFAEMYNLSKATVTRCISELQKRGYIEIEIDKAKGNKRYIKITKTRVIPDTTPSSKDADTSMQTCNEPINKNEVTSAEESNDPLSTNAEHNIKKVIELDKFNEVNTKNEGGTEGGTWAKDDDTEKREEKNNELVIQNNSNAPEPPTLDKKLNGYNSEITKMLLERHQIFDDMSADEQAHIVMGFYLATGRKCEWLEEDYKKLRTSIKQGLEPELFIRAIWRCVHSRFANDHARWNEKIWDMRYLCDRKHLNIALNFNFDINTDQVARQYLAPFKYLLSEELQYFAKSEQ